MITLDEIGIINGTDKSSAWHNYLNTYELYFEKIRNSQINVLEIGILNGSSLKTWREYFKFATIWGVDIDQQMLKNVPPGCVGMCGDSNDPDFWRQFSETRFDIIIDDGDHKAESQEKCFGFAFPRLVSCGLYIIEDVLFSRGKIVQFINPVIDSLNDGWFNEDCSNPDKGKSGFRFVHLYKGLVLIGKK